MDIHQGFYRISSAPLDFDRSLRQIRIDPGYYREIKVTNLLRATLVKPVYDFFKDLITLIKAPVA